MNHEEHYYLLESIDNTDEQTPNSHQLIKYSDREQHFHLLIYKNTSNFARKRNGENE